MSSAYKKMDNNSNNNSNSTSAKSSRSNTMEDDLEKSSFIRQANQQQNYSSNKPIKKTNYGSLRTENQQIQTAKVFIVNHRHKLSDGETLQGISLKYGVSVSRFPLNLFILFKFLF